MYAGIGDWGCSTSAITTRIAIPLRDESVKAKDRARDSWPWMAPECLRFRPEPWSKKSDMYSLGHVIKEIVNLIDLPVNFPKRYFVSHISTFATRAMDRLSSNRPTAYKFVMCMARAQTYGLDVPRNSGLCLFDE